MDSKPPNPSGLRFGLTPGKIKLDKAERRLSPLNPFATTVHSPLASTSSPTISKSELLASSSPIISSPISIHNTSNAPSSSNLSQSEEGLTAVTSSKRKTSLLPSIRRLSKTYSEQEATDIQASFRVASCNDSGPPSPNTASLRSIPIPNPLPLRKLSKSSLTSDGDVIANNWSWSGSGSGGLASSFSPKLVNRSRRASIAESSGIIGVGSSGSISGTHSSKELGFPSPSLSNAYDSDRGSVLDFDEEYNDDKEPIPLAPKHLLGLSTSAPEIFGPFNNQKNVDNMIAPQSASITPRFDSFPNDETRNKPFDNIPPLLFNDSSNCKCFIFAKIISSNISMSMTCFFVLIFWTSHVMIT